MWGGELILVRRSRWGLASWKKKIESWEGNTYSGGREYQADTTATTKVMKEA